MVTPTKLKLLLVEDSRDDEALLLHMLEHAAFELDHLRVETAAALRAALRERAWDIVVSDFSLPELDAPSALTIVRELKLDVPFVVVSGTVGEDRAVELMRLGANDYVMKSNLRRLPETIRREVKEARSRSERRSLEEQVRQAQKMEAIGQLASSVAHDFNNLLTVMISFSQFVHDELPEDHSGRADLKEVVDCGNRAALLTRQLLTFSRKTVNDPQLIDLNAIVDSSEKMLKRLIGHRIDYATVPSPSPSYVIADRSNIEQVLVNLIVNARDAMPDGGKLTVETGLLEGPPPRVMLAISDTGTGMSEAVQQRIFEPFFTTKGTGRGTGLGLSTVHGIVAECGAEISLHSTVGQGTTFKVLFPRASDGEIAATAARPVTEAIGGTETVLVVEDQEPVRAAVERALRSNGYAVLQASRPGEALALIEQRTDPLHLVLTDMMLPEMTGKDLVARLRRLRPDAGVLYMSGFAGGALAHQGVVEAGTAFLQKPFTPEALVRKVRAALDTRRNP